MSAAALLLEAAEQGVILFYENGRLGFELTRDQFPPALKERILAQKASLIEYLARLDTENGARPIRPPILPQPCVDEPQPLSFAQTRLWLIHRMRGGSPQYNIPIALRVAGDFNEAIAAAAFRRIIERHSVLRTTYEVNETQPLQRVRRCFEFVLDHRDLRDLATADQQRAIRTALLENACHVFDLSNDLMLRAAFLRVADEEGVLLFNVHHIASDGWSMQILMREFVRCYESLRLGREPALPVLEIQYTDYARWQRAWLQGPVLERQLQYWEKQLAGLPQAHSLPLDHPRPTEQRFEGGLSTVELDAEIVESLKMLSRSTGSTLFMVLHAAFTVLLSRYSNGDDIVIGTPVANRLQKELEPLVGFFVNMLVLRVSCAAERNFLDHLQLVRAVNLDAQAHQDVPFEMLVERLQPERSLAHSPLFQIVFSMNTIEAAETQTTSLRVTPLAHASRVAKFDLEVNAQESRRGLKLSFVYNRDLFDSSTVRRLATHFARLLRSIVARPQSRIGELEMLDEAERRQLLEGFAAAHPVCSADALIHELFEAQVLTQPHAVAVIHDGRQLSYAALNCRANQLAHWLRGQGVGPDTLVGLCVERSLEMVVAILAILKSGGAYVPLDPSYPQERLAHMLSDSAPAALVTQSSLLSRFSMNRITVLCLDEAEAELAKYPTHNISKACSGVGRENLAYVIYTSGSTGHPKGVMVEHANVSRLFAATREWFDFGSADVWTLFHSYAFDFSVWEIWGALIYGGRLVVVPTSCARSPVDFYALVCREGVTVLNQTPSAFRQFIHVEAGADTEHRLRFVIFGGEALELAMLAPWMVRNDPSRTQLVNMYGITEITVHGTYRRLTHEDVSNSRGSLIGVPIPDLRMYILDCFRNPVPIGVYGEIHVAGAGVARGYLNRPELTAERFILDPFSSASATRMYKSGDLGRWLPDGSIEYLGRNDFQVKIRGFRIETGEVEAKLLACDGVRDAVVIAREDAPGDKQLVAYLTAKAGVELSVAALREALQSKLAHYMVPAAYVVLESFPLTNNGKLDRQALPAPDDNAVSKQAYEDPVGTVEQTIAQVWQQLLNVPRIGRHDHFFELGGHSLLVIRMIEQLCRHGLHADVKAIFENPTLSGLAAQLNAEPGAQWEFKVPPNSIAPGSRAISPEVLPLVRLTQQQIDRIAARVTGGAAMIQDIYPLSPLQHGMLFHHILERESGGDTYLLRTVLAFDERSRRDAFLRALQVVIDRHEILRTSIHWRGLDDPLQVVHRQAALEVEECAFETSVLEKMLAVTDPRCVRLDLQQAPLLRAYVADDQERGELLLVLLNHHIIDDNYSLRRILAEVREILQEKPTQFPAPVPFRNFVARTRATSISEHEAYFRAQLGSVSTPTAPYGVLDVRSTTMTVHEQRLGIEEALSLSIRSGAKEHSVSPAVLFHLAWAIVLARCTGREEVVFGTVLSGRLQGAGGIDQAVGMFINTLPLRVSLSSLNARAAVRQTYERLSELLRHELAPLSVALNCSGVKSPEPLFTTLLNCRLGRMTRTEEEVEQAARVWSGIRVLRTEERANFPIYLAIDDLGSRFGLTLQCCSEMDAGSLAHSCVQALRELIDALAKGSVRPLVMPGTSTSTSPGREAAGPEHVFEHPEGELEESLARIWQELLGVSRVGRGDDFFALGGHSLLALKMMQLLPIEEAHQPPLATIFSAPRLADFAAVLCATRNQASAEQYSGALQ
jgi:amino acid adenylation domain-containing protein